MTPDRRQLLRAAATGLAIAATPGLALAAGADRAAAFTPAAGPRSRFLLVNDLSGDIDGLFAAVHAILSPSAQLRGIIATRTNMPGETAARSVELAHEMLSLMGRQGTVPVHSGGEAPLAEGGGPLRSAGALAIVAEAMRDDPLPLFVGVGGGLGEVASALMIEPRIAERMTVVWIGGEAYPAGGANETNFDIDPVAARHVFNETGVGIWQVPRDAYATCLVSSTELQAFVAPCGAIGDWLYRKVVDAPGKYRFMLNMGETWTLGDNPLILLTALTDWPPSGRSRPFRYERTGSSLFDVMPAPRFDAVGGYVARADGRPIRVYRTLDTRMMLGDMFAKLRVNFG